MPPPFEARTAPRSPRRALVLGILVAALAGGFLNLGVSLLDHPRAFGSFGAVLAPLALSVGACLALALVVVGAVGFALGRLGVPAAAAATAGAIPVVLAGALQPVLEGIGRELAPAHLPALWGLAAGAAVCAAAVGALVAARSGERGEAWTRIATFGVALAAAETFFAQWLLGYPLATTGGVLRLLVVAAWLAAMGAGGCVLAKRRICPFGGMVLLLVATLAAPMAARVLGGSSPAPSAGGELPEGRPHHVVLITVDTLRPDMIGGGEGAAPTPALDSLLADSVVFSQARAAAPWTKPSVASILTGLSPLVHGATSRRTRLPDEVHTIAEYMHDAGYATVGVGLNVHLERLFHFSQGFDEYFFPAREDFGISLGARILRRLDAHRYPELFPTTTAITDRTLDRLAALGDRPFFLWVHVLDPHWPYEPPAAFLPARDPASRIGGRWGEHETVTNVQAGNIKLGEADRARVRDLYRGEIEYVDANIARLLDFLRKTGIYDDALIAFTSDHGEEFWEHGRFEHGHSMYDEVLRVPLAFKLPGAEGARTIEAIVSNESLTPTLLDLVGHVVATPRFTSPSLAEHIFASAPRPASDPIYGAATYYYAEQQAVIFEGLKAIVDLETGRVELFDLQSDPTEHESLTSTRPADVKRAAELLRARAAAATQQRDEMGLRDVELDVDADMARLLHALGYGGDGENGENGEDDKDD